MKAEDIEKRQVNRFIVLMELYKLPISHMANSMSLAYEKGIKNGFFEECFAYLKAEGFIDGTVPKCKITHAGRKAIESTILHPDEATDHFPAYKEMGL